jgi:hypothetical protein
MEPITLLAVVAVILFALLRRPGNFSPALVLEGESRCEQARPKPEDEEEQMPETDRAPRPWLPWAVAAIALVRVTLLVTLHA